MRKGTIRRIALNLVFVMLLTLLPAFGGQPGLATTASAYGDYGIVVGVGKPNERIFGAYEDASGSGWRYDSGNNTLYLNGYSGGAISSAGDLTVVTSGTVTINAGQMTVDGITHGISAFFVGGNFDLTVQSGTLTATGGNSSVSVGNAIFCGNAIYCEGSLYLSIYGGTAKFTAGTTSGSEKYGVDAIYAKGVVSIYNNGKLTITANSAVLWGGYGIICDSFDLYGSGATTVTAGATDGTEHNGGIGIYATNNIYINAPLTVKGGKASTSSSAQRYGGNAIYSDNGDVTVCAQCTATGGYGYYAGAAIFAYNGGVFILADKYANGKQDTITLTAGTGLERWAVRFNNAFEYSNALTETGSTSNGCYYQLQYTVKSYTLVISGNGGTSDGSSTKTVTKPYSTNIDLSSYAFTKAGYTFVGWREDSTGSYYAWNTSSYRILGDDTLVAQYVKRYTGDVLLLPSKYAGLINGYTYYYEQDPGSTMFLPSEEKSPLVYGTSTTAPAMDANHVNASPIYAEWYEVNATKQNTLYAYRAYVTSFTNLVIYHPTEGSVKQGGNALWQAAGDELTVLGTSYLTAPSGMEFAGWSDALGGPVRYEPDEKIPYYKKTSRLDLYAVWKPISYTLTLNGTGGTVNGQDSFTATSEWNNYFSLSEYNTYKSGYSLKQWCDSASGTCYSWGANTRLTKNTTLEAQWQERKDGDLLLLPSIQQQYGTTKIQNVSSGVDYVYYSSSSSVTLPSKNTDGTDILWAPVESIIYSRNADGNGVYREPVYTGTFSAPAKEQTTLYSQRIGLTASWGSLIVYHPTDGKAANGGSLLMQELESYLGKQTRTHYTLNESYLNAPEGYHLAGWSTMNGGEVSYEIGEPIYLSDDSVLHLYAVWSNEVTLDNGWIGAYTPKDSTVKLTIPAAWAVANGVKRVVAAGYYETGKYKKTIALLQYSGNDWTVQYSSAQQPNVVIYALDQNFRPIRKFTVTVKNDKIELS